MCGITGIVNKVENAFSLRSDLELLNRAIFHRGPDETGSHVTSSTAFLNRRLAIVDIAGGSQPIFSSDGKIGIVYNGEVYNFLELRKDLEGKRVSVPKSLRY